MNVLGEARPDPIAIRDGVSADAEGVIHAGVLFILRLGRGGDWRESEQREGERELDLHEVPSMGRQLRIVG